MKSCVQWNTMTRPRFNYSYEEVVVLIEEYETLNGLRATRPGIHIRLLDIDTALRKLSKPYREAVFLCGIVGLTARTAGKLLGKKKSQMRARYIKGMDALYELINTGGHYSA